MVGPKKPTILYERELPRCDGPLSHRDARACACRWRRRELEQTTARQRELEKLLA